MAQAVLPTELLPVPSVAVMAAACQVPRALRVATTAEWDCRVRKLLVVLQVHILLVAVLPEHLVSAVQVAAVTQAAAAVAAAGTAAAAVTTVPHLLAAALAAPAMYIRPPQLLPILPDVC